MMMSSSSFMPCSCTLHAAQLAELRPWSHKASAGDAAAAAIVPAGECAAALPKLS